MTERLAWAEFLERTAEWAGTIAPGARRILAIAGAPGSGKSTLAEELIALLNGRAPMTAAILPMDGYHYDDEVLVPKGWRPRKGAPHTFDIGGFAAMLARLRTNAEPEIAVPRFDRDLEIARAGAVLVPHEVRLIVAEGNYLLLDEDPWRGVAAQFDRTAFLDVPMPELERRLRARWDGYRLEGAELSEKLDGNDLPNVRLVVDSSQSADFTLMP